MVTKGSKTKRTLPEPEGPPPAGGGSIAKRGQATFLDDRVRAKLIEAIKAGAPQVRAAAYVGISPRTFRDWLQRGRTEEERLAELHAAGEYPPDDPVEEPFLRLWRDMEQARAEAGLRNITDLQRSAHGGFVVEKTTRSYTNADGQVVTETNERRAAPDWRAAAWWLERQDRENFGKEALVQDTGTTNIILAGVDITSLADRIGTALEAAGVAPAPAPPGDVVDGEVVDDQPEQPAT